MKKKNNTNSCEDTTPAQLPNFSSVESKVFTAYKGKIYIGREEVKPEFKEALREQARYLMSSQLYEIFKSTIINEASQLSLIQSTEWEHVLSAKMLWHWQYVLDNILKQLTEK